MAKKKIYIINNFRKKVLPFVIGGLIVLIPLFILSMKYKESVLADSLMSFDEGYGSTSNSANTNVTGTITNALWKPENMCVSGKCLYFDGTGDYVSYGDDSDLDFAGTDTFTIEGWFRTGDITSGQRTIVAKYNTGGGYKVYMDSSGYLLFGIDNDNSGFPSDSVTTSTTAFDDNKWHYFAAIKNGSSSITLYVDNIQYGTDSSITSATLVNSDAFYIGMDGNGSSNGWSGFLDEIKVYRSVRTAAQINTDLAGTTANRGTSVAFGANQKSLSNGLVGYWKMDENTGLTTYDSSGNGNNITMATLYWAPGKYGAGLMNGGTVDSLNAGSGTSLDNPTSWTYSAWIYSECIIESYDDRLLEKAASTGIDITIPADSCTIRATQAVSGTDPVSVTSSTIQDSTWLYLTVVYSDDSRYISIYFNGIEQPYATHTHGASSSTTANDAAGNFILGNRAALDRGYLGSMDEVRFYNRALSSTEVVSLYTSAPGPVGYWKMDESNGQYVNDSSGNNLRGTLGTSNASASDDPTWTNGKYGESLSFDGGSGATQDDVVYVTNNTLINNLPVITYEAWIYPKSTGEGAFGRIINKLSTTLNGRALYMKTNNILTYYHGWSTSAGNIASWDSPTDSLVLNQWNHVAVAYDDTSTSNDPIMYVNGVKQTVTETSAPSGVSGDDSAGDLLIGNRLNGTYDRTFDGYIDDVKIYNYARNEKQVIEDMNGGHPIGGSPVGSQLIYWNLDESNGTTAHNTVTTQTALTGTLSGAAFYYDPAQCKVNSCAAFGASTDYISGGDIAALDGATNLSFSFWYSSTGTTQTAILSKWNNSNQDNFLIANEGGELRVYVASVLTQTNSTSPYFVTSGYDVNCPTYCHIGVVYDGTLANEDRIKVYENGTRLAGTVSGTIPTSTTPTSSNFKVGASDDTSTYVADLSVIDELKVYTASLSQNDILIEMNAGSASAMGGVAGPSTSEGFGGNAPIAWWKYDDNAGTTAIDTSGNSHTQNLGASTAAPTWVIGRSGTALKFDGANDYAATAGSINLSSETTITVEFWLNWDAYANDDHLAMEFTPNLNSNSGGFVIDPNFSTSGTFAAWQMNSSGSPSGTHFVRPSAGAWHHYAIIFDKSAPSATDTIPYVDGAPVLNAKPYTATMDNTFANNSLYIMSRAGASLFGAGRMDDVKIYNYARTPAQIAYDYNRGQPIVQYDLDECTGAVVHNTILTSNKQHSATYDGSIIVGGSGQTATGDCTTNANTPWYNGRTGKYASSVKLDGSDDYISISNPGNFYTQGASSMWVYPTNASPASTEMLIQLGDSGNRRYFQRAATTANLTVSLGSTTDVNTGINIPASTWTHLVITWDSTNYYIYINGKLRYSSPYTAQGGSGGSSIYIGSLDGAGGDYYAGQVDAVQVYTYILNAEQIRKIYNEGSAIRFGQ